jgi:hypothetical protein
MRPKVHTVDTVRDGLTIFQESRQPSAARRKVVKRALWLDVDESRKLRGQPLGEQGRMIAPGPIEFGLHPFQPAASEISRGGAHDQGVAQRWCRPSGFWVLDVPLPAEHEGLLEQRPRQRTHEQRVDVRVHPTTFQEFFQPDKVCVVGIPQRLDAPILIPEPFHHGMQRHFRKRQLRLDQVPIGPIWLMVIVEANRLRLIDAPAGLQAQIVGQM